MNHPKIQKVLIKIQKLEALRARRLRPLLNKTNSLASSKAGLLDKIDKIDTKLTAADINLAKSKLVGELTKAARDAGESPTQYLLTL